MQNKRQDGSDPAVAYFRHLPVNNSNESGHVCSGNSKCYKYALYTEKITGLKKVIAVPLQAWSGPEGSRKLRFPDFVTTALDGGKVVSLTHRPPLPQENAK